VLLLVLYSTCTLCFSSCFFCHGELSVRFKYYSHLMNHVTASPTALYTFKIPRFWIHIALVAQIFSSYYAGVCGGLLLKTVVPNGDGHNAAVDLQCEVPRCAMHTRSTRVRQFVNVHARSENLKQILFSRHGVRGV
jgi:hypothetical protein